MVQRIRHLVAKVLMLLLTVCMVIGAAFLFAGCSKDVKSVQSFAISNGELIVTYSDGTTENLGSVVGTNGTQGEQGPQGPQGDKGDKGDPGEDGADGLSITKTEIVDGHLILTFSDNTTKDVGVVVGADGTDGRGIVSIKPSEDGTKIVITYTDETTTEIKVSDLLPTAEPCTHEDIETVELKEHTAKKVDGEWTFTNGTYLDVCNDCGHASIVYEVRHVFGEQVKHDATCTEGAYYSTECTCGYEQEHIDIPEEPALGHNFDKNEDGVVNTEDGIRTSDVEANACEEGGTYLYMCSRCNAYDIRVEEAAGHHVAEWTVSKQPTEEAAGEISGVCADCGETIKIAIPALTTDNAGEGKFYTRELTTDGKCVNDSVYTYTLTIAEGTVWDIDGVVITTAKTTVTTTEADEETFQVTIPGGSHYTVDIDGKEVAIEIDGSKRYGIEEYPEFEAIGNDEIVEKLNQGCSTEVDDGAVFRCKHCGELISVDVYGYHDYDEDTLEYHPATCTTAGYWTVYCKTEATTVTLQKGSALDEDAHDWKVTVKPNADGKTATITSTCKNCHKTETISNATLVSDTTTYPEGVAACEGAGQRVQVFVDADGKKYTFSSTVAKKDHVVLDQETGEATQYTISDEEIAGSKIFTEEDPEFAYFEALENVPKTCKEEATQCMVFRCATCGQLHSVYYRVPHTLPDEPKTPATCTTAAVYVCTVCSQEVSVGEPLGHDYVMVEGEVEKNEKGEYVMVDVEGQVTITYYCAREGCDLGSAEEPETLTGTLSQFKVVATTEQTCQQDGIVTITYTPAEGDPVVLEGYNIGKANHTHGTFIFEEGEAPDGKEPYEYDSSFMELLGNTVPACTGEAEAVFRCDDCDKLISIMVKGPHDMETAELKQDATHNCPAIYHCTVCGAYFASGEPVAHTWQVKAGTETAPQENVDGSITLECTGCEAEKTITLPKLSDAIWKEEVLSDSCVSGKVVKYSATISFTVTGDYTYSGSEPNVTGSYEMDYTWNYSIEVTERAASHSTPDANTQYYQWTYPEGENGITYIGYICKDCGEMVVVWRSDSEDKKPTIEESKLTVLDKIEIEIPEAPVESLMA